MSDPGIASRAPFVSPPESSVTKVVAVELQHGVYVWHVEPYAIDFADSASGSRSRSSGRLPYARLERLKRSLLTPGVFTSSNQDCGLCSPAPQDSPLQTC